MAYTPIVEAHMVEFFSHAIAGSTIIWGITSARVGSTRIQGAISHSFTLDPLETTCETEGGSPEFLTNKPSADAFDFYDELKRDGRIPYNPKTFYISANEPWGQNYNVPIIVIENEYRAPLALVTHIFEPKFPANYEAARGAKNCGSAFEDSIADRPPIVLTLSNKEKYRAVVEGKEADYIMAEKLAAYENTKIKTKNVISGFFGGTKNQIISKAANLKDKVGAGLAKTRHYGHEESKEDYPRPDPAGQGGKGEDFNLVYDIDPEWLGPPPEIKPKPSVDAGSKYDKFYPRYNHESWKLISHLTATSTPTTFKFTKVHLAFSLVLVSSILLS
ncbi:uncharacterized protein DFL_004332 [Arthrobotrys flagrans]|uniref:Uncharacterized protein n=1 Tax=Arthrobotrys flagrans TaxID=97331 RepID=A0A437A4G8_ARTFL|nr:hypothetical protein DFL_004332 [Arthrobotrys flagrans]